MRHATSNDVIKSHNDDKYDSTICEGLLTRYNLSGVFAAHRASIP